MTNTQNHSDSYSQGLTIGFRMVQVAIGITVSPAGPSISDQADALDDRSVCLDPVCSSTLSGAKRGLPYSPSDTPLIRSYEILHDNHVTLDRALRTRNGYPSTYTMSPVVSRSEDE